jgi:uncharacterized alkaline shock family protein YloU
MVRPTFSSLGSYSISDEALKDLIEIVIRDIPGVGMLDDFKTEKRTIGVVVSIEIALVYGYDAQEVLLNLQQNIGSAIEDLTSITIVAVNVRAVRLIHSSKESK